MQKETSMPTMTEKELFGYRQWLAELNSEAAEESGDFNSCDPEVWEQFDPESSCGSQIYHSFRDEELLDVVIATMGRQGRKPRFDRIHIIYRRYLRLRFGS